MQTLSNRSLLRYLPEPEEVKPEDFSGVPPEVRALDAYKTRREFLDYLQKGFPYGEDCTLGDEIYTVNQVHVALQVYRKCDPDGYLAIWLMWVSHSLRKRWLDDLKIAVKELTLQWSRAADSIVTILRFPELQPQLIQNWQQDGKLSTRGGPWRATQSQNLIRARSLRKS